MKTRFLSLLIVASLFISTALTAQPTKEGKRGNKNPERSVMMQKRQVHQKSERQNFFTEEQQETIKTLRLETAKKVKPLKNQLRELAAHQQTLTTAESADLKAINKNIEKMAEAKTEIAKIMAAQHQQVRSLLTEEQLLKFDARNVNRGEKRDGDFRRKGMENRNQMHQKRGA